MILNDWFSGIGGFAKGLHQAGFKFDKHYFREIDKHAIAIYKHNFPEAEYDGSVTDRYVRENGDFHVFTFGSPCQDFSLAGKRKGLEGERSSLIEHAITFITEQKPDVFIWENVKGVFSSNNRADFWAVIQAFTNIGGYRLEWQLLNTAWFLPQNRERVYLVGTLGNRGERAIFPVRESDSRIVKRSEQTPSVRTITAGGNSGGMHSSMTLLKHSFGEITQVKENPKNANYLNARDYKDATSNILCIGSNQENASVMNNIVPTLSRNNGGHSYVTPVITPNRKEKRQSRRFKEAGDPAFTLTAQGKHGVMITQKGRGYNKGGEKEICPTISTSAFEHNNHVNNIRRLTEIECERLQGFKDNWTKYGNYDGEVKKVSATQRYKCLGNAVTVDVVEAVARSIKENYVE